MSKSILAYSAETVQAFLTVSLSIIHGQYADEDHRSVIWRWWRGDADTVHVCVQTRGFIPTILEILLPLPAKKSIALTSYVWGLVSAVCFHQSPTQSTSLVPAVVTIILRSCCFISCMKIRLKSREGGCLNPFQPDNSTYPLSRAIV